MVTGASYLRTLADGGVAPDDAARLVEFRYAVTDEQFPTIASCAPPVGTRAGAERGHGAGPAPACGHQPADDEQVRPLGEHAPHHRRRLRRGRRGSRRGHRAALRLHPRRAGRLRSPDRPQHLQPADLRVPPGPGRRPGGRFLRRRAADRRPGGCCLGALRKARGGCRSRRADRGDGSGARAAGGHAHAPAHRAQRVPQPLRGPARARAGGRPARSVGTAQRSRCSRTHP